jgi:hypothetical protein
VSRSAGPSVSRSAGPSASGPKSYSSTPSRDVGGLNLNLLCQAISCNIGGSINRYEFLEF